jgi:Fe-S-cluster containining protein
MKRSCPYCSLKFKGKEINAHVFEVHHGRGAEFFCKEGCVRCCTDVGAPLELLIDDIKRIVPAVGITFEEFFENYAGILWSSIPGTRAFVPSIGLPFPCRFLKEGRCTIYDIRPLHCVLFPERLYIDPSSHMFKPFYRAGYVCVDEGFFVDEKRAIEIEQLMEEDQKALIKTAEFFKNEDFIYEFAPAGYEEAQRVFRSIDDNDPDRNRKKREIIDALIPAKTKNEVKLAFLARLKKLD